MPLGFIDINMATRRDGNNFTKMLNNSHYQF